MSNSSQDHKLVQHIKRKIQNRFVSLDAPTCEEMAKRLISQIVAHGGDPNSVLEVDKTIETVVQAWVAVGKK